MPWQGCGKQKRVILQNRKQSVAGIIIHAQGKKRLICRRGQFKWKLMSMPSEGVFILCSSGPGEGRGTRTLRGVSPRGMGAFLARRKATEQQSCPFSTMPGTLTLNWPSTSAAVTRIRIGDIIHLPHKCLVDPLALG